MRTLLAAIAASALLMSLGASVHARSDQTTDTSMRADRGCATMKEFRHVKNRMTVTRVSRILGTPGRLTFAPRNPGSERFSTREYRTCSRPQRGALSVDFSSGRVLDKFVLWTRSKRDSPRCVSNREYRRIRKGMSPRKVHRIFDTAGGFMDGFAGGYARGYHRCRGRHVVVTFVSSSPRYKVRVHDKRYTFIPRR